MTHCPHCGGVLEKPRSSADHRRFFKLISAAFSQWPEGHEFQPDNAEHLRAWLLCKAGYRETTTVPVEYAEGQPAMLRLVSLTVESAVKAANGFAFIRPHGAAVAVHKARSIKFEKLSQKSFGPLRDAVTEIITAEIGVDASTLLRETVHAA
jgi:hypothetical protein